jgi:1-acyl-sn-glycerol-3-phosphate acyltransferase
MNAVRSIIFTPLFWGLTILVGALSLPLFLLPPRHNRISHRIWAGGSAWLIRHVMGISHKIEGLENLPQGACILACKHQSVWETVLFAHLFWPVLFVLKRELTWLPLFGWAVLATRQIIIDRKAGTAAMRHLIREGKRAGSEGARIPIFPEGTRVRPGSQPPLQPGVVALARHLDLPVVPIALNSGEVWPRRGFFKKSGMVTLRIFPPLPAGLSKTQLLEELHRLINTPVAPERDAA